ncbi:peptidase S8/S53 domain-containing protein [Elsinoe ampelina]|uniref:Peptidase S8/S53 domain-containing protein n=1 Tax=Elsinoe ampelina TaxID=302913 RepID=A0A6A6G4A5_9PEZI|nr:peptidase S8/S53 domain-containing protein [Elsinoe ampelina]
MVSFKALSLVATLLAPAVLAVEELAPKVPGAYIVEFHDDQEPEAFMAKLGAAGQAVEPRLNLKYDLFKGVSFKLKDTEDEETAARKIEALPEVRKIWPVRAYPVPRDEVVWTGNERTAAPASGLYKRQDGGNDTFSPHIMTQVDQLRSRGIRGAGIKVAVIDTGIDYNHPALGGCFGEGCLVSFGTDLVGNNYDGFNTPVPDPDPYDNCEGHGTHVAGIIAAQNNPYGFTGAAPDVTIGAYRVFGCGGSAGNDVLIAAYNQAYQDGAQIITASIGGPSGWTEEPWAAAVSRIVEAGVPCTVSAGNDGAQGQFYASTAANGKRVSSIASVDNTQAPTVLLNATFSVGNSSVDSFGWTQGNPAAWGNVTLPLWSVNYNTADPANACNPLPDDTPDLSGYVVLVRRGTCTFVQKVTNLAAKGAKYIMFYNNADGASAVTAVVDGVQAVGMTTAAQGAEWISLLSSGNTVTLSIVDPEFATQYPESGPNTGTPGFLSTFTSWGPTYEVDVKQQFSAPGGLILSTYPLDLGGYAVLSGTSMACPFAAAVYALVSEVRGTLDPATLENVISATANPQLFNTGRNATFPYLAPPLTQPTPPLSSVSPPFSFNDTDNFADTQNFTISNLGTEDITWDVSHIPAGTFYTLAAGSTRPQVFPNTYDPATATLEFSSKSVTIPAGGSVPLTVFADLPAGLDASRLPVYSGYIALNSTDGQSLSVPYLGVVGSLTSATVLEAETTYLSRSTDADSAPVDAGTEFILPAANSTGNGTVSYPQLIIDMVLGTPLLSVAVRPTGGNGTAAAIYGYPIEYQPRGVQTATWNGLLADGNAAAAGEYEFVVRALHIFGDRESAEAYDEKVSVGFSLKYV